MAKPTTVRFGKFRVLLGDNETPVVYTAPCGFTSKSLNLTKNLSDLNLPDCDDPDAPAWVGRDVESLSASISGEGVLASESVSVWLDAYHDVESVPVKVEIEFSSTETITYTGNMHISSLEIGAQQGGRATLNVSMESDGELVKTVSP